MKICLIGKYPPIEGGVSMRNYWMARALAERGHVIHVVTNAPEVESEFRIHLSRQDKHWYEPRFGKSKGFVKVIPTEAALKKYHYIPWSNPFVTKLASIATRVIREYGCEVIYSYYFEPYGVAAHLASRWTGVPYILRHAGSDLGRLMKIPDLKTTYEEILKAAGLVVTQGNNVEEFMRIGVRRDNIFTGCVRAVPTEVFNPQAKPLDVHSLLSELEASGQGGKEDSQYWRADPIDYSKPTIGIYGKVGEIKGSYDLLRALGRLQTQGLDFNLLAMTNGLKPRRDRFFQLIAEHGLASKTWIVPFLPSWRVPSFIRRCTAVCFLERNFPIAMHGPSVPREVLACGTCLVVSLEIARKQPFVERLIHGVNAIIVRNPEDEEELAAHLRFLITQSDKCLHIGAEGHKLSSQVEDYEAFVDSCEVMFQELGIKRKRAKNPNRFDLIVSQVKSQLPWTSLFLQVDLERWVRRYIREKKSPRSAEEDVGHFARFLGRMIAAKSLDGKYVKDILRYDMKSLPVIVKENGFYPYESLIFRAGSAGLKITEEDAAHRLKPYLLPHVEVESFDYDVDRLIRSLQKRKAVPALQKERTYVLFRRALVHLRSSTYKINSESAELISLLDGTRSLATICSSLAERYNCANAEEAKRMLISRSRPFLQKLFEDGAVGYET